MVVAFCSQGPNARFGALSNSVCRTVLYMSGYSHQVIARQELADQDVVFVEKPFTTETLLTGVRSALDTNRAS